MKSVEEQFADVQRMYPDATLTPVGGGMFLVRIPQVPLPEGWSQAATEVRFIVPNGYPYSAPDCFWANSSLRLKNGGMPQNTRVGQTMPGQPDTNTLWFSWHVNQSWNASTCALTTYVNIILNRFKAVQ